MTTATPFEPLKMVEAIRFARESGVEDAVDRLFTALPDEELVRTVWVLHDMLRGLNGKPEWRSLSESLFAAQTDALLVLSIRFAEEPFVAIMPEHLRWHEEEWSGRDA